MYVYIRVYVHLRVYVHKYVCVHVCVCVTVCMSTCVSVWVWVCTPAHVHSHWGGPASRLLYPCPPVPGPLLLSLPAAPEEKLRPFPLVSPMGG